MQLATNVVIVMGLLNKIGHPIQPMQHWKEGVDWEKGGGVYYII